MALIIEQRVVEDPRPTLLPLRIVEEEADESIYWMELLIESGLLSAASLGDILRETDEITAMTVASIRTLQKRHERLMRNRKSKIESEHRDSLPNRKSIDV